MKLEYCSKLFIKKGVKKSNYIVWKEQYRCLAAFMVSMFLFSALQIAVLSVFLVELHLSQILEIGFIKSEQIFSNMLAELKQNELNLIQQGLWGSAKSISDMISRPEIIDDGYLTTNKLVSAYEFYKPLEENSSVFSEVD